jgi:hypothetical protein
MNPVKLHQAAAACPTAQFHHHPGIPVPVDHQLAWISKVEVAQERLRQAERVQL